MLVAMMLPPATMMLMQPQMMVHALTPPLPMSIVTVLVWSQWIALASVEDQLLRTSAAFVVVQVSPKVLATAMATFLTSAANAVATEGSCAQPNVTFQVDMNLYGDLGESTVFVNGNFNGWCGACNPMSDDDGDGVWTVTLPLDAGTIEYKFTVDGWNSQENFVGGESCTISSNGYTNRVLTFDADTVLPVVCWNSALTHVQMRSLTT